jgi:hypothetical protein
VVVVGFGDGLTGPTVGVVGTWKDWTNPFYFRGLGDGFVLPDGGDPNLVQANDRVDIAVIELAQTITSLTPMPVADATHAVALGTPVSFIGYGRVTAGAEDEPIPDRPDERDRFPGQRKRSSLQITGTAGGLGAEPQPGTTGGVCYADSGGPLILEDGAIVGTLAVLDGDGCSETGAAFWVDLRLEQNAAFIRERLSQIGPPRN